MDTVQIVKNDRIPLLVVIIGPTAAGKSDIAIQVAERLTGEIVSADSRLFYRGMDIGTAKPSVEDRQRVRHHLIDVADPDEAWSLAIFQKEARRAINEIHVRHHLPFLVGGTGQFVRSVIEGWSIPGVEPNLPLRHALELWSNIIGPEQLHSRLETLDSKAAQVIDYHNVRRTIRALEVIFITGRRFSEQKQRGQQLYDTLTIGINRPRNELYQRIDDRIDAMITSGLIAEVQQLLERGYSPDLPTMSAIGYGEIVAYLQGKTTIEEAIVQMKRRTRDFVRRQANWFNKNDPDIHWYLADQSTSEDIELNIRGWLANKNTNPLNSP